MNLGHDLVSDCQVLTGRTHNVEVRHVIVCMASVCVNKIKVQWIQFYLVAKFSGLSHFGADHIWS